MSRIVSNTQLKSPRMTYRVGSNMYVRRFLKKLFVGLRVTGAYTFIMRVLFPSTKMSTAITLPSVSLVKCALSLNLLDMEIIPVPWQRASVKEKKASMPNLCRNSNTSLDVLKFVSWMHRMSICFCLAKWIVVWVSETSNVT